MRRVVSVVLLSALSFAVIAEDATKADDHNKPQKPKFVVDMADSLDFNSFHNDKDAEAVYSTEFALPWKKKDAVNAYQDDSKAESKSATRNGGQFVAEKQDNSGKSVQAAGATQETHPAVKEEPVSTEATAALKPGTAINIRVRYTLDVDKSSAQYSPSTAVNALFHQMAAHCQNGFLKMGEWSTPIAGSVDYYLYYQFQCIAAE